MYIGHWSVSLAAAAASRKSPKLATLFIAAQLVDWLFFALLIFGIERMRFVPGISAMNPMDLYHLPYTHSLLGSAVIAALFGFLLWLATKNRTTALIGAAVVLSHWFLDLLVHIPDLTLAGSPPKLGLGLWNHPFIEMPLEIGITALALFWYWRARQPSAWRLTVLALLMFALQAVSWFSPTGEEVNVMLSIMGFIGFALPAWAAWWMERSAKTRG